MEFQNSQTFKNLKTAFTGESLARNRYTYYAEQAKKEGHPEIQTLFETMARNETAHGKILYRLINGGISSSTANLSEAMEGEFKEWTDMYPSFAQTAREEGFEDIALTFEKIAAIEKNHEHQFLKALAELQIKLKNPAPAKKETKIVELQGYRCMFCESTFDSRIDVCPQCGAIGSFEPVKYTKEVEV